jgi:hypothetical protein
VIIFDRATKCNLFRRKSSVFADDRPSDNNFQTGHECAPPYPIVHMEQSFKVRSGSTGTLLPRTLVYLGRPWGWLCRQYGPAVPRRKAAFTHKFTGPPNNTPIIQDPGGHLAENGPISPIIGDSKPSLARNEPSEWFKEVSKPSLARRRLLKSKITEY